MAESSDPCDLANSAHRQPQEVGVVLSSGHMTGNQFIELFQPQQQQNHIQPHHVR